MYQLGYIGLRPLPKNNTYVGGLRRFWYLPVEHCRTFPRVSAATQYLVGEPGLEPGAAWFGPIDVPRNKLGYSEEVKRVKAGPFWEQKIEGTYIGESPESRVLLGNMVYHKYLVVGQVRAGGHFILFGSPDAPLELAVATRSGTGPEDTVQSPLAFVTEAVNNAYILPSFTAAVLGQGNPTTISGGDDMNLKEVIPFSNAPQVIIPWTALRQSRFGNLPTIQVWLQEGSDPPYLSTGGSIEVDAPPPGITEVRVNMGGSPSGFIVIE